MAQPRRTAIVYDFDGTLASGNLQEQSFIPDVRMSREEFWGEVKARARDNDADEILVYMHVMPEKAKKVGFPVTKDDLRRHGREAPLFPSLADGSWFRRLDEHAAARGLGLEHYIVSSGIHEMILRYYGANATSVAHTACLFRRHVHAPHRHPTPPQAGRDRGPDHEP